MISVITPVFNGEKFIRENIESVRQISFPHEHIIVDGGSTDGTIDILSDYPELIVLHQKEKTGMYGAIDMGFSMAEGEYICWVNCDDRIIPNGFEKMYVYAQANKHDFVCSDGLFHYIKENRKIIIRGTRFIKYFLSKGLFPFSQPSSIYTKQLYQDVNGLDFNKYKFVGDMALFYKMATYINSNFSYIPVLSTIFLKHGNSLGDNNSENARIERLQGIIPKPTFLNMVLLKIVRILNL